jgi:hypothetical protein
MCSLLGHLRGTLRLLHRIRELLGNTFAKSSHVFANARYFFILQHLDLAYNLIDRFLREFRSHFLWFCGRFWFFLWFRATLRRVPGIRSIRAVIARVVIFLAIPRLFLFLVFCFLASVAISTVYPFFGIRLGIIIGRFLFCWCTWNLYQIVKHLKCQERHNAIITIYTFVYDHLFLYLLSKFYRMLILPRRLEIRRLLDGRIGAGG